LPNHGGEQGRTPNTIPSQKRVKWHDGVELTSDDVVFTYLTVTNPKVPTPYGSNYGPVEKVEAVDKHTVKVTYKEPYARLWNHGAWALFLGTSLREKISLLRGSTAVLWAPVPIH